jgi:hypothetical protein
MRKASMMALVVGLTVAAPAGMARAAEATATPVTTTSPAPLPPPPVQERRLHVGVSFLPMSLGKFTASYGGMRIPADAAFAPGVSLSVGYQIIPRYFTVGLAPQVIFNVGTKEDPTGAGRGVIMSTEYDFMARAAGTLPIVETIALYAEVLPGYSLIKPSEGNTAKGLVLAGGAGAIMDLSESVYVNLGVGYQYGFQSRTDTNTRMDGTQTKVTTDVKTQYYRVSLGVGVRF